MSFVPVSLIYTYMIYDAIFARLERNNVLKNGRAAGVRTVQAMRGLTLLGLYD
jgi:hypothetical protein